MLTSFEEGALAMAMERARRRWERTDAEADYTNFLEAENRWMKCRLGQLCAAVARRQRGEVATSASREKAPRQTRIAGRWQ
ncbi:hypothetical protein [Breoghania sp. L-A4]|uniref:hypothetical protein n=1 Tax=Breoghania sp. L-A4 TaxID=2304600 RepID=UPI000E35D8AD|nr:hypothetical protein [Breoghania sp. L-A4]AXS39786.1 hypothetical protein D1F64_06625 [Breoghania sp. L-A4]